MSLLLAVSSKSWFPQALSNLLLNPTFSRRLQREHQQPLTANTTSPSHNMFPVFPSTWILQYSTYNTWSLGYHLISSYSPTTTDDNRVNIEQSAFLKVYTIDEVLSKGHSALNCSGKFEVPAPIVCNFWQPDHIWNQIFLTELLPYCWYFDVFICPRDCEHEKRKLPFFSHLHGDSKHNG